MTTPVRIAITGAAGQISYSLLFRLAADALALNKPIELRLLELPQAQKALQGVVMELADCAFPALHNVVVTDKPQEAFADADIVFLVGARPRGPGMERADLLQANAHIFSEQGRAINDYAAAGVKVLIVGNPANTNALITQANAPDLDPRQVHAMMRLDHNRAQSLLANYLQCTSAQLTHLTVWGNHSAMQYPDIFHARCDQQLVADQLDQEWLEKTFIPTVQKRGAAIIEARGASSAASAANAAIDHMHDWLHGTQGDNWVSMGVASDGSYGIAEGVVFGFPCRCHNGDYEIVQNIEWNDFSRKRIVAVHEELLAERAAVASLL